MTTLLLFWALHEYFSKKRPWLLGLLSGIILLTRVSAFPIIIFFLLQALGERETWRRRLAIVVQLLASASLGLLVLLAYNYQRFRNIFEQGYNYQVLSRSLTQARTYGLFSYRHIPGNLYYSFLASLHPVFKDQLSHVLAFPYVRFDVWGLSLLITSPYLIYLGSLRLRDLSPLVRNLLVAISVSALMVFSYYGIGYAQFGYRYALDFLPLVFVIFILSYKNKHHELSARMKTLILCSGVFNLYLLVTFAP